MVDSDNLPAPLAREALTFSGRTVEVLRDMVLTGRVRPGERLNEVEIANALGISRGPLREAIQHLRSEGLLITVSHRGAYVRTFTRAELSELYEVRIALESHAVRLAAEKSNQDGIDELRQMMADTNQALAKKAGYPSELDFHQRMVLLADNEALLDAVVEVHRKIGLARSRSAYVPTRARTAFSEHEEVLEHLANSEGELAAKVLTTHLRSSLANALKIFDTDGATK
jgi:DNA-binding GntR family transcriptional regulator